MIKNRIIIMLIMLSVFSCKTMIEKIADETNESKIIRVKILNDKDVKVFLTKDIIIEDDLTKQIISFPNKVKTLIISQENSDTLLNGKKMMNPIVIKSLDNKMVRINNVKYFGSIKINPDEDFFEIINIIPMETYLMSVILSEIPISFNIEAVKAQTIVARTYAQLFVNKYSDRRDFDVDNTTNYQAYKGFNICLGYSYIKKLEQAVKETNGLIIVYDDKPIIAYFHANSGGKIRSGGEYFGKHSDLPYLISQDDPYSVNYPGSKWEYKINLDIFKEAFDLTSDPQFDDFIYNKDGFIEEIDINDKIFYPKEIRKTIGYTKLKSERFKVFFNQDGKSLLFTGIGYGHGVGMSQWGAQGMAEEGFNYKDIIKFYYPNTEIKNILK